MPIANPIRRPRDLALLFVALVLASYVCVLAVAYYFHLRSIQRHHLESAWMWLVAAAVLLATMAAPAAPENSTATSTAAVAPRQDAFVPFAFVAIAIALFYPVIRLGFLSDDFTLFALAARNQFVGQSWVFLRPLPLLFYKAFGTPPALLHVIVIVLHGINAALVFRLAATFGLARPQAIASGIFFLAFPAHLEAVAWCAGIQDVLMTTGVLAAVVAATASSTVLSLAAVIAALCSKETAVATPILMWLANRRRWRTAAAALGVAAVYTAWRIATRPLAEGYAASPSSYTLKELLVRPFGALAVPFRGAQLSATPLLGVVLVSGLALLVVRAAWLWRGDRAKLFAAGALVLWVMVSIAPVYSMFDVSGTLQGSRYVYLAAAGWSMLLASVLMPHRSRVDLALVIAVCIVGAAGVRLNLVPWNRAARMRDEVLAAVERARAGGCTAVWIRNVPDSTQGAYVFRNGLAEAIAPTVVTSSAPPGCWIAVPFTDAN